MNKKELQHYYDIMDKYIEKLMIMKNNKTFVSWDKIGKDTLELLVIPSGDLVEKINASYSSLLVVNDTKKQYLVIGEYCRKDFYNEQEYDLENEIFITVYQTDDDKPNHIAKGKIFITENIYKNYLIEAGEASDVILNKLNLLSSTYSEASLQNSDDLFN
ncbi:hypothetical protein [Sporosarcina sp. FSL K6-3457]|uniref:hypothetical protein n=1 Tax=Sporosarcina sp. FSL K6-3457 TaxID=2978204 RepID=UPI0030F51BA5